MYKFLLLFFIITTVYCNGWHDGGAIFGIGINATTNKFYAVKGTQGTCDNFTDCIQKMCIMTQLVDIYWPVIKPFAPNCTCDVESFGSHDYQGISDGGIVIGIAEPLAPIYKTMRTCVSANDCARKMINIFCDCSFPNLYWVGIQFFNNTNCN